MFFNMWINTCILPRSLDKSVIIPTVSSNVFPNTVFVFVVNVLTLFGFVSSGFNMIGITVTVPRFWSNVNNGPKKSKKNCSQWSSRFGVAESPRVYLLSLRRFNTSLNSFEAMWWHSSTITKSNVNLISGCFIIVWILAITIFGSKSLVFCFTIPGVMCKNSSIESFHWFIKKSLWTKINVFFLRSAINLIPRIVLPVPHGTDNTQPLSSSIRCNIVL